MIRRIWQVWTMLAVFVLGLAVGIGCDSEESRAAPQPEVPLAVATAPPSTPVAVASPEPSYTQIATVAPEPTATAGPPLARRDTLTPLPDTPSPTAVASIVTMSASALTPTPVLATPLPTAQPPPSSQADDGSETPSAIGYVGQGEIPAPAPAGLDGWINSPKLEVEDLEGKVVLLDFWTYTCVNCIRTLPYLKEWHRKYADSGLLVLGVHTPEFEFEKVYENVVAATEEFGIEYAVAQDNYYITWLTYRVQAWPTKYIVDPEGFVRFYHRGEGAYADTESVIRFLLEEAGADLSHIEPDTRPDPVRIAGTRSTDLETFLTREMYGGTRRNIQYGGGYVLNEEFYEEAGTAREYTDPGNLMNHFLVLSGLWTNTEESLVHARETGGPDEYLRIRFFANEVNVVMSLESEAPYEFTVTMDGEPVPKESAGADIEYDDSGNSLVRVDSARMYRLIRQVNVSGHNLTLYPQDDRFAFFAFTFGAYANDRAK